MDVPVGYLIEFILDANQLRLSNPKIIIIFSESTLSRMSIYDDPQHSS